MEQEKTENHSRSNGVGPNGRITGALGRGDLIGVGEAGGGSFFREK